MPDIRAWPFWQLPRSLTIFIAVVVLADAVAIAASAVSLSVHAHDLEVFGVLLVCVAATVELTRRGSEPEGPAKDIYAIWELPVVIVLPPLYALLTPAIRLALTQWRVRRAPAYRRVFTAAAIGIAYGATSLVFRALDDLALGGEPAPTRNVTTWLLIVALCAITQWAVNHTLVLTAIKVSAPETRVRELLGGESLRNDVTELCVAVLATLALTMSLLTMVIALPFVTMLQRSFRHAQLVKDSRADSKTGLLNAATWEREAAAEIGRAVRTRSALAVALLDIDRFKSINDTYGHLVGDQVIKEIARTLDSLLRDYDLAGRFGGEEFSVLLPQTRAVDAFRIAERIRSNIAALSIIAPGSSGGERVHVTVSIGVAALDSGDSRELADLMGAADAALYRAKASGRDQVQMISTTRGLSAVSGVSRGPNAIVAANTASAAPRPADTRPADTRPADTGPPAGEADAVPGVFRRAMSS
jgi:diguanylate cyclase (GGDEF)-like protein